MSSAPTAQALERERRARSPSASPSTVAPGETTLEDVFIRLMSEAQAGGERRNERAASALSRIRAVLLKEVIQMRRDRLTFAMIVGIPIIQLVLFGYAINTDPKQLPTGIVMADPGPGRARDRRRHADARTISTSSRRCRRREAREGLADGIARLRRHRPARFPHAISRAAATPQIVVEADATDPGRLRQRHRRHAGDRAPRRRRVRRRAARRARAGGGRPEVVVHRLYNPEGINTYNIVPGLIGTILTMTTTLMTALALTREIERGTMENLLAMPVRPVGDHDRQDRALYRARLPAGRW